MVFKCKSNSYSNKHKPLNTSEPAAKTQTIQGSNNLYRFLNDPLLQTTSLLKLPSWTKVWLSEHLFEKREIHFSLLLTNSNICSAFKELSHFRFQAVHVFQPSLFSEEAGT
ncbi:hypothetical protein CHARACLAT_033036 [Characodon lateralis]|uniref:Uncharacterized protein n=1 Tax=Characodon lateralis TaxID=208331 RepID=A0ABU7D2N4_9TELE|nr:hypothetical protein [Characodon lateralis]